MKLLLPDVIFDSLNDVTTWYLKSKGIKGVIMDLDNTLVPPHTKRPTQTALDWLSKCEREGMQVYLVSNNNLVRVREFCEGTTLKYIHRGGKPLPFGITKARKLMGISRSECALIGDQILTDVLGARLAGIYSIMVRPLVAEDGYFFRMKRKFEKLILKRYRKRGK